MDGKRPNGLIRRLVTLVLAVVLLAVLALGGVGASAQPQDNGVIPGQFIVVVNPGQDPGQVAAGHGAVPAHVYRVAARGFAARLSQAQVSALRADPRVNNVVPDRYVQALDDPDVTSDGKPAGKPSGGATVAGQSIPAGVRRVGADQVWGSVTGTGVGVAIIDTGTDYNHPDLAANYRGGYDFVNNDADPMDDNGHGTHVTGIVAASNNGSDVVGVAPNANIYAVKVLNQSGGGTWSGVMAGVDWVTTNANNIKVANMSLGGSGSNSANCGVSNGTIEDPLHNAICNSVAAGVTYVVAAGNDASKEISQMVPAAYPEVIAVASTTAVDGASSCKFFGTKVLADTASYFTTDGAGVAVSAPGEDKEDVSRSCFLSSVGILSTKRGGGTTRMSGTSMAAPHVAGVAALVQQAFGGSLSPADVRSKITSLASRKGTAPLNSPSNGYTFDGVREGVVWAPGAIQ